MSKQTEIQVKPLSLRTLKVSIIGKIDLLTNVMSEKTKDYLEKKMEGKGTEKTNRNFLEEVKEKSHILDSKGTIGIPTYAFKTAIVESAVYIDGMDKKLAKSIIVEGDFVPIKYKTKLVHKTFGRPQRNGVPMPVYRPQYKNWSCELTITFNSSQISAETIINLLRVAGFHNGVGSWSPRSNGSFGVFDVELK